MRYPMPPKYSAIYGDNAAGHAAYLRELREGEAEQNAAADFWDREQPANDWSSRQYPAEAEAEAEDDWDLSPDVGDWSTELDQDDAGSDENSGPVGMLDI